MVTQEGTRTSNLCEACAAKQGLSVTMASPTGRKKPRGPAFLGIDLAAITRSAWNSTAFALLPDDLELAYAGVLCLGEKSVRRAPLKTNGDWRKVVSGWVRVENARILQICHEEQPALVAIDAPLSLSRGICGYGLRECDYMLMKGVGVKEKVRIIPTARLGALTSRGIHLKEILALAGHKVIEVHPRSSYQFLNISPQSVEKIRSGLSHLGIKRLSPEALARMGGAKKDILDAICAAYTAWLHYHKKTLSLGNDQEGYLIVPK
jgi:predicted nuclease with RNAse H fold